MQDEAARLPSEPAHAALLVAPARVAWGRHVRRWSAALALSLLPPLLALAALFAGWLAYVEVTDTPAYLVPSPGSVFERWFSDAGFFAEQGWATLRNALAGLGAGGAVALALAVVMAHNRFAERSIYPLAILVKVTPVVAVAPLFTIWWGFGLAPKVAIAALIAWFPLLVNAITGFRSVDPAALAFLRSLHASPLEIFLKLRLPSSLPYLLAGLRVAAPLSVIGAVVAEWFGASQGLGRVIQVSNANLDLPTLFAAVMTLAVIGVALNTLINLLEGTLLSWHESAREG